MQRMFWMVRTVYNLMSAGSDRTPFADGFEHPLQEASSAGLDTTQAADSAHNANDSDAASATDTDLLEFLANSISTNTKQGHPVEAQSAAPPPIDPLPPALAPPAHPPQPNADSLETLAPLAIDPFPHGNPGAPIPAVHQGSSRYQRSQEAFGASVWAPFTSQCDWEMARWAKMRGPTSSAVEDLLAIPEVCPSLTSHYCELTHAEDR